MINLKETYTSTGRPYMWFTFILPGANIVILIQKLSLETQITPSLKQSFFKETEQIEHLF